MAFALQTETPPLHEEADGALRVGSSRVLLELVIRSFQDGATPETIVQRYSTLALSDVYAVIAYYLRHPEQIEKYLNHRERQAAEIQRHFDKQSNGISDIRARLLARRQS